SDPVQSAGRVGFSLLRRARVDPSGPQARRPKLGECRVPTSRFFALARWHRACSLAPATRFGSSAGQPHRRPASGTDEQRRRNMKLLKRGGIGLVFLFCLLAWIDPSLAEDMTASIQTARMTVMEVKRDARQLVYVNSQGRVHVHKVTDNTAVVRDDE